MGILRATAVLMMRSGDPADASRNVWHFNKSDGAFSDAQVATLGGHVGTFYSSLASHLAACVTPTTNAHRVELADVTSGSAGEDDDVVSALRGTVAFTTATTTASVGLPPECAAVMSFRGTVLGIPESASGGLIRPRSRRRGRIYLGPLSSGVADVRDATTYECEIRDPVKEAILDAYDVLHDALVTMGATIKHVVYSRADGVPYPVEEVSVNNEFDTVRRRGRKPTNRYVRDVSSASAVGARTGTEVTITV